MSARADFDVLIVGGGMVGTALAALLVSAPPTRGLSVAIVEPRPVSPPLPQEPLELRVSALSRAAEQLLRSTGAWPRLAERGPCAYERMIVWDASRPVNGPGTLVFDAAEAGEPNLGWIAENRAVTSALLERALAAGATLLGQPVTGLELGAELACALTEERRIAARLVVAADGAGSKLRRYAGIGGDGASYPEEAIIAHLAAAESHGSAARQRFLPDGPLALLPLADGRVSLVWSTRTEHARELLALDDAAFGEAVTAASEGVLGALRTTTPRAAFALARFNAKSYVAPRLALVGDAAHSVHPLAGQGVNQGLMDAAALAGAVGEALERGEDPGDARALGRYARARRADNALAGAALDGLWRLFADRRPGIATLRHAGLALVNRSAPAKRYCVRRALGL
jgi:2-octaprenylphenol hydroxylase